MGSGAGSIVLLSPTAVVRFLRLRGVLGFGTAAHRLPLAVVRQELQDVVDVVTLVAVKTFRFDVANVVEQACDVMLALRQLGCNRDGKTT